VKPRNPHVKLAATTTPYPGPTTGPAVGDRRHSLCVPCGTADGGQLVLPSPRNCLLLSE
jgi:hypothetical protein